MSMSLRDQLIQAGLASEKKGRQVADQQRRERKQDPNVNAAQRLAAEQAQAAKVARDQELNRKKRESALAQARMAEVKQLVEQNRLPKIESEDYFNFVHRNKIRRICVNADLRQRLTQGEVLIVRCEGRYEIVPSAAGERIRERHANAVVSLASSDAPAAEDEAYKDFPVPDDLKW